MTMDLLETFSQNPASEPSVARVIADADGSEVPLVPKRDARGLSSFCRYVRAIDDLLIHLRRRATHAE